MRVNDSYKIDGEFYLTLCSKETWAYKEVAYPKIDKNSIVKTDDGPEKGIPHFYVTLDDILSLLKNFFILRVRHVDDCFLMEVSTIASTI